MTYQESSAEYEVELLGEVREVYVLRAFSEQDARERWSEGKLLVSEASSMEIESVREVES